MAERAVREFGDDPAVRRVCHAVVPVAPATAVAAARLGDDEHRRLRQWVASTPQPRDGGPDRPGRGPHVLAAAVSRPATLTAAPATDAEPEIATALLERLGPLGARRAVRLVRGGEGETHAELAGALVRHSGLGELQELIGSRFLSRADALRSRSVLAGLAALLQAAPPPTDDGSGLLYQLERVRAGAHELRELELLDVLRSGDLHLPDEQRSAAERLLGADGDDSRARLGLGADATAEQVRAAAAAEAGQVAADRGPPGGHGARARRRTGRGVDVRAAGGRGRAPRWPHAQIPGRHTGRDLCAAGVLCGSGSEQNVAAGRRTRRRTGETMMGTFERGIRWRRGGRLAVLVAIALLAAGCGSGSGSSSGQPAPAPSAAAPATAAAAASATR